MVAAALRRARPSGALRRSDLNRPTQQALVEPEPPAARRTRGRRDRCRSGFVADAAVTRGALHRRFADSCIPCSSRRGMP